MVDILIWLFVVVFVHDILSDIIPEKYMYTNKILVRIKNSINKIDHLKIRFDP